jgi:hypothetical protein
MGKIVRAGAGAGIFHKLEPELEPDKNGPAPQHWVWKTIHLYECKAFATIKAKTALIPDLPG